MSTHYTITNINKKHNITGGGNWKGWLPTVHEMFDIAHQYHWNCTTDEIICSYGYENSYVWVHNNWINATKHAANKRKEKIFKKYENFKIKVKKYIDNEIDRKIQKLMDGKVVQQNIINEESDHNESESEPDTEVVIDESWCDYVYVASVVADHAPSWDANKCSSCKYVHNADLMAKTTFTISEEIGASVAIGNNKTENLNLEAFL